VTTIPIPTAQGEIPYHLAAGALDRLAGLVGDTLMHGRAFVVTDATVGPLYGPRTAEQLGGQCLELPAGEDHKNWGTVERVIRWLIQARVERSDAVVAVGGGVVTDLAGFAAAITLRGLAWVAVPTTLLGMVDAAVGGKTGVDLESGKNLIGCFWQPRAIVADPLVLATLDHRQLRSGLAEVVKAAMISPSTLEAPVDSHLVAAAGGDLGRLLDLVAGSVRLKAEVVSLDERDGGARAALNLGHTLGHALEAAGGYCRLLHGEAVAWGLLAALALARGRGLLATSEARAWAARIGALAPLPTLDGMDWPVVASFMGRDKKRRGGQVHWVLPRLGGVALAVAVEAAEVEAVYRSLQALPAEGPFTSLF
jgi:3-dehydroquinate synthetase